MSERWQRIREVFHRAVQRPAEEWPAFLDDACGDDTELRAEVESLLASHREAGSFIESSASGSPSESADAPGSDIREPDPSAFPGTEDSTRILEEPPREPEAIRRSKDPLQGQRIGPYRVLHRLGAGGMGAVYLAVRDDEEFQRRVALKVLKPGMDSEEILRRFRTERQILAALDHPHIAKLLDGGTTDDGLPYFAMEYVEGKPLHRYCDEHKLSIRKRLKLFRTVCSAVQFAHQNLVVHRDLKPGNILVTPDGHPKLLDFGIAKLLNPELSSSTLAPTALGMGLMTVQYASPEQLRGGHISTASDIYSLGVLLYELLTGHHPYRDQAETLDDVRRWMEEEEPERPSTVVLRQEQTPAPERTRRHRALSGDLDHILLMALRKEPRRRYASAEQFAEDIRRHLEGLPVLARRSTLGYRVGKFLRRHRVGVAATTALLLASLGFGLAMARQSQLMARERDRAERVTQFLIDLFKVSDPYQPTGEELLDRGAQRLAAGLGEEPELRADLMATVGRTFHNLGLYEKARPLLESALEIRRSRGDDPLKVAESLHHLGLLHLAEGDYDEAEELFAEALELRRGELGDSHLAVAEVLDDLGELYQYQGRTEEAEARFTEALQMRRRLAGADHPDVAESLQNLASVLARSEDDRPRAERLYRESLAMHRTIYGDQHPHVGTLLSNLAHLLQRTGQLEEAEGLYRESLTIRRQYLGDRHPNLANSLYNLANLLVERGEVAAAEPLAGEALEILRQSLPEGDQRTHLVASLLGGCLIELGRYEEAEALLVDSLPVLEAARGADSPATQKTLRRLVRLYEKWGKEEDAAAYRAQLGTAG